MLRLGQILRLLIPLAVAIASGDALAAGAEISFSGRVTDTKGAPLTGPRHLEAQFFRNATGGTALPVTAQDFPQVELADGAFVLPLSLTDADVETLFNGVDAVWIEVKDVETGRSFTRQKFGAVPLALKVPVDGKTVSYDGDGKLRLGTTAAVPGSYLTVDSSGALAWTSDPTTPAQSVQQIAAGAEAAFVGTLGPSDSGRMWYSDDDDVLKYWNGTQVVTIGTSANGLQSLNGLVAPSQTFAVGSAGNQPAFSSAGSVHTLDIPNASAGASVTRGLISNADYVAFSNKLDLTGGTMTGPIDMGGQAVTNLPAPSGANDAVTKSYVDTELATKQASLGFTPVNKAGDTLGGDLALNGNKITDLGTPTNPTDAATKGYVDTGLSGKQDSLGFTPLDKDGDTMAGVLDMNGHAIVDLGAPTVATDAATKGYVDSQVTGHTHAASAVTTDSSHRFVTDAEKSSWNTAAAWGDHAAAGYLTSIPWNAPGAIGSTTPSSGAFTTLSATPAANQVGVTVTGAAAQTANLQEWRNSGGSTLAAITKDGELALSGATNSVKIKANSATASYTLTLPDSAGTNGYVLATDGAGNTSWVSNGPAPATPRGFIRGSYVSYSTTTAVTVSAGSGDCDGTTWTKTSSSSVTISTLTTTQDFHYLYLDCSALPTITIYSSTTEPAYDGAKGGWYNASGDRVLGAVLSSSGTATIYPFDSIDERIVWTSQIAVQSNGNPAATYQATSTDVDTITPVNTRSIWLSMYNQHTSSTVRLMARSVAQPGNLVDALDYGSCSWSGWMDISASDRSIEWAGEDNDENLFAIAIRGYEIQR